MMDFSFSSLDILPENAFGTEFIPILISSDSSDESADEYSVKDTVRYYRELRQKKRECKALYTDVNLVEAYAGVERERRMALEAHLGCKFSSSSHIILLVSQINLAISLFFKIQTPPSG